MQLCPEEQLLVQCSRVGLDQSRIEDARHTMATKIDWDYLLEASIRHGTAPLFHLGLKRVLEHERVENPPPQHICAEFARLYEGNRKRNQRLYKAIGQIARAFHDQGVDALGLKDLQLAWEVYPDLGMRTMGDIDILIHRGDYDRVAECMHSLGFRPLPSSDIPFTLKYAWAHHFHRPEDNLWIDLQWNVVQREWDVYGEGNFDFEINRMWRHARTLTIDGAPIFVPSPEDMLFHLCLHLEGHQYSELILFSDIEAFLHFHGARFNWPRFIQMSLRYNAQSSVYYVLLFADRLFHLGLPEQALKALAPKYYQASLFPPLFENLTSLHLSLDDIRLAVSPPEPLLAKWEEVVRRQTVSAMGIYRELDQLATEFTNKESAPFIFSGAASEKIFPDPTLEPFRDLHVLVVNHALEGFQRALENRGFKATGNGALFEKQLSVRSRDPALQAKPTNVHIEVRIEHGFESLDTNEPAAKKRIALRSLKHKLTGQSADSDFCPTVKCLVLSPEELLVVLCSRIGQQRSSRLFEICTVLQFLRTHDGSFNWELVRQIAADNGLTEDYNSGASAVVGLMGESPVAPLRSTDPARARLFEWARYGPNALDRHPGLKRAFYYAFTLLSLKGVAAKSDYVQRSLRRDPTNQRILPDVLSELLRTSWNLLQPGHQSMRDFAYWLDTDGHLESARGTSHERT
jgi:hypothetical protein